MKLPEPKLQVELIQKNRAHFYKVQNGGPEHILPGVTGILGIISKPALVPWATKEALKRVEEALVARLDGSDGKLVNYDMKWIVGLLADAKKRPDAIKDDAADYGTKAHAIFDAILKGQACDIPEVLKDTVDAFKGWLFKTQLEIVAGDTKVASIRDGYGGSFDALGWDGNEHVLIDFKTSSGIWPEYSLQVAAYCNAVNETYGIMPRRAIILRVDKKPPFGFEVKEVKDVWDSLEAFLAAKRLKEFLANDLYV